MPITSLPYATLGDLLTHSTIVPEDPDTAAVIKRLGHVRRDHELSRREFLEICHWKSPRSIRHCERNSAGVIRKVSREVFTTRSERQKVELLTSLHGVSVPTASAILTLTNPKRYGVIDIRVWQLLYALGAVSKNPRGQGFTAEHWLEYLRILRYHAKILNVPVRLVELTLFRVHEEYQEGILY